MSPMQDDPRKETPRSEDDIAKELRLRPDPPRVMRLSRKAITLLAMSGGLGIGVILIFALQGRVSGDGPTELFSTDRVQEAEGLSRLPSDYGSIPRLGPPLPGEFGRPVLAQRRAQPIPLAPKTASAIDPDEQLRIQEAEAARIASLFVDANTVVVAAARSRAAPLASPDQNLQGSFPTFPESASQQNRTQRQGAFLDREVDRRTTAVNQVQMIASPYVIQAGSVIEAALLTGLRSDLPGQITAQVTANVYDSVSGRFLLVPQGSRLLGEYDSSIAAGQRRLLLAWTRLILPNGRSIVLERQPGTDEAGYAGLQDGVDNHWDRLFLAAGLATILNIGLEAGRDSGNEVADAIRDGVQDTIGRAGDAIVRREISIPPTLTIRPGFPVRVMVTRDLILEPIGDAQ